MSIPKDGTPILAYCINRHTEGWMVIAHNGRYWQTIPGKYGVERIVTWAKLPVTPSTKATLEMAHDFLLTPHDAARDSESGK